jgi:hypothetical protein
LTLFGREVTSSHRDFATAVSLVHTGHCIDVKKLIDFLPKTGSSGKTSVSGEHLRYFPTGNHHIGRRQHKTFMTTSIPQ